MPRLSASLREESLYPLLPPLPPSFTSYHYYYHLPAALALHILNCYDPLAERKHKV